MSSSRFLSPGCHNRVTRATSPFPPSLPSADPITRDGQERTYGPRPREPRRTRAWPRTVGSCVSIVPFYSIVISSFVKVNQFAMSQFLTVPPETTVRTSRGRALDTSRLGSGMPAGYHRGQTRRDHECPRHPPRMPAAARPDRPRRGNVMDFLVPGWHSPGDARPGSMRMRRIPRSCSGAVMNALPREPVAGHRAGPVDGASAVFRRVP